MAKDYRIIRAQQLALKHSTKILEAARKGGVTIDTSALMYELLINFTITDSQATKVIDLAMKADERERKKEENKNEAPL